ncbi:HEWD family protein [Halalkalicoccus subterraneus]|uniref:HEWD family protein n=1 Tax=Halalkalicoccus subterraneus TaxID=2675002 RepID=UPI000EFBFDBD|nr:HEWD family protein [Halalkalicoccus subterraneus]
MLTRTELRTPQRRECERCDREEVWDAADGCWRITTDDGERRTGNSHCIHEWDIDGTFRSYE